MRYLGQWDLSVAAVSPRAEVADRDRMKNRNESSESAEVGSSDSRRSVRSHQSLRGGNRRAFRPCGGAATPGIPRGEVWRLCRQYRKNICTLAIHPWPAYNPATGAN